MLNWWLHHLLLAGTMFFAAGAQAIGGDGAAVDAGVDAGANDGTGASGENLDQSTDDSVNVDDAAASDQDSNDIRDEDGQQQVNSADQIKSHIEELKKTNPALAKELKNTFFMVEAMKKEFPGGLPELRQVKQTIDDLGGTDGIEGLKAERAEWNTLDDKFINGDATVLDDFAKFNPESFAKIAPAVLDKLATIDKSAYDYKLSGIFAATLDSWRFFDSLDRVAESIGRIVDEKGQPLCVREIQLLQGLAQQYESLKKTAAKAPEPKPDASKGKIDEERAQLARERQEATIERVTTATESYAKEKIEPILQAEAKRQGLNFDALRKNERAYTRFANELNEEIGKAMATDAVFARNMKAALDAGDKAKAISLSNGRFDVVKADVARLVVKEWASTFNPRGPQGNGNGNGKQATSPTPAGVKKLEGPPDLDQVDKTVPNWREEYMLHSKAKLKSGQRVQW